MTLNVLLPTNRLITLRYDANECVATACGRLHALLGLSAAERRAAVLATMDGRVVDRTARLASVVPHNNATLRLASALFLAGPSAPPRGRSGARIPEPHLSYTRTLRETTESIIKKEIVGDVRGRWGPARALKPAESRAVKRKKVPRVRLKSKKAV